MRFASWWLAALVLAFGAFPAGGGLFVVSQNNARVLEFDAASGAFVGTTVEPIEDGFQNPGGLALHPGSGVLYVSSTGTGEIWTYTTGTETPLP